MNKNLLGISAKIGSGKDTFFEILQKKTNNAYENKKFAGKLKQIASIITGIPVEKFEDQNFKNTFLSDEWSYIPKEDFVSFDDCVSKKMTVRYFLQKLGTEAMRDNLHTNVWVNALFSNYVPIKNKTVQSDENFYENYPKWCVTDLRFPNEYNAIKERGGVLIRINRPGITQNDHPSETSLDNHKFDYVIDNNGTIEDFEKKIEDFLINFNIIL